LLAGLPRQEIVDAQRVLSAVRAHRTAADDELPDDAYGTEPLELLGGCDFDSDDQREIKQRLPH
jgi:hypothetical protein